MMLRAEVHATFVAVVQKFPHTGGDDDRRAAMEKAVATIRARHGLRYVWKTEHSNLSSPSKDGMGYVPDGSGVVKHGERMPMYIWDMINGSTREPQPAHESEELREAFVLAPEPKDWLATTPTPDVPVPPLDVEQMRAELRAVQTQIAALHEQHKLADAAHDELATRVNALQQMPIDPQKVKELVALALSKAQIQVTIGRSFAHSHTASVEILR